MRLTSEQWAQLLKEKPWLRPDEPYDPPLSCALPNPESQCDQTPALGEAVPGKEEGMDVPVVRFVGYRIQPLDPDNFAGSVKDLLDGLRHSGLLRGDNYWQISLLTEQVKVGHRDEERTEITIIYP